MNAGSRPRQSSKQIQQRLLSVLSFSEPYLPGLKYCLLLVLTTVEPIALVFSELSFFDNDRNVVFYFLKARY
jgi:hypothetical protein